MPYMMTLHAMHATEFAPIGSAHTAALTFVVVLPYLVHAQHPNNGNTADGCSDCHFQFPSATACVAHGLQKGFPKGCSDGLQCVGVIFRKKQKAAGLVCNVGA